MHYYKFNIADYRKDTTHLSAIEHYIYRQLIDWYYLDERPIPTETQQVIRRLSLGNEHTESLENILQDFFKLTARGWTHARIDRELIDYHNKAAISKVNGSKGGRPRKTQQVNSGLQKKPNHNLNHKPLTNNHKQIKEKGTKFVPPSTEEVRQYILEKGYQVNAEAFVAHYESNGWKVGMNKMKSWRAAVTTWQTRGNVNGSHQQARKSSLAERAEAGAAAAIRALDEQDNGELVVEDGAVIRPQMD